MDQELFPINNLMQPSFFRVYESGVAVLGLLTQVQRMGPVGPAGLRCLSSLW